MNKRKALFLLQDFGEGIIEFRNKYSDKYREPILCTTDFKTKYIRSIIRYTKFPLKGNVLVFNYTDNKFDAIPTQEIKNITPLATILRNVRDA